MTRNPRVLCQVPDGFLDGLEERFPAVEFLELPFRGPIPDVHGEILYTWSRGANNTAEVLDRGVRWVHTLGTGVDDFPLELIGNRTMTCARGAAAVPIAEWVLASMLAYEKQIPEQWAVEAPESFVFASLGTLSGRRLGLFGFGSIAQRVAELAIPFRMQVRALRRTSEPSPVAEVELVTSIGALVEDSDHIVIAAPLTPSTALAFDGVAFTRMKQGVHLVNIARGGLVDQEALRSALDSGRVARASLDTTTPEPLPTGHWMYRHPNVRVSPHISWSWPGARERTIGAFAHNLERWLAGKPLDGVVDVEQRY